MKTVTNPKEGSDDKDNNENFLACKEQSSLEKQDDAKAMPSELQRRTPNEPNSEEDLAQGGSGSRKHDTRF